MQQPRKLKRVVIKEELVTLTGDFRKAIILNQMIYWSERVRDVDAFITEENERLIQDGSTEEIQLQYGWIYKKADELAEEIMLNISSQTILRDLNELVEAGWLSRRTNPKYTWDKTYQYRVNLSKIQDDLALNGYTLEGYGMSLRDSNLELRDSNLELRDMTDEPAIPEITTETTTKITTERGNHLILPPLNKINSSKVERVEETKKDSLGRTKKPKGKNKVKDLVDYYSDKFLETYRIPTMINGGQASKIMKSLANTYGFELAKEIIDEMFRQRHKYENENFPQITINSFSQPWIINQLVASIKKPEVKLNLDELKTSTDIDGIMYVPKRIWERDKALYKDTSDIDITWEEYVVEAYPSYGVEKTKLV